MLGDIFNKLGFNRTRFRGGLALADHKITAQMPIRECPLDELYIVPLKQHIGTRCTPLVKAGDYVMRGQKIAKSEGYVSAPVHAPTSGNIVKIEEHKVQHPSGLSMPCIFLEPDGRDAWDYSHEPIENYRELTPAEIRERIRVCGIVGLGGAVFPTYIKAMKDKSHPVKTVILNGIECEPYLTNDHRMMLEHTDEIASGLDVLMHAVGAECAIIAIEDNKPDAAEAMQAAVARHKKLKNTEVHMLPTAYPQGSEKQLIQSLTGKHVPVGKLPIHIGILCQNVSTVKAIHDAVLEGHPLTERVVTVSGEAVPKPGNMLVRLGTSMRLVLKECGLSDFEGVSVIHGGPMMGELLHSVDVPITKSSIGLLAKPCEELKHAHPEHDPCIRCGHCGEVCPISLIPSELYAQCRSDHFEKARDYNLFDCIECGCCSYVCPSQIPLVQYFRYGKGQTARIAREQASAEIARNRSEARELRLKREKQEREVQRAKMKAAQQTAKASADDAPPTETLSETQAKAQNKTADAGDVRAETKSKTASNAKSKPKSRAKKGKETDA